MISTKKSMKILSITAFIFFLGIFSFRCSEPEVAHDDHEESQQEQQEQTEEHAEEVVRFSQDELNEFQIELATAGPGIIENHVDLTGEIAIDPNRLAHIVPRFPGIVKDVYKKIGDNVEKDEVLAVIESNESLTPYEVRSLIKGTVIDMHLTRGEVIADLDHAFTVADLSEIWANLNIYQNDLSAIRIGQKAIITAGHGLGQAVGKISYISPIVSEETRTTTARVILPNPDYRWRPGLFITAEVVVGTAKADVVVPKTALQTFENQTVIFVKTNDGFQPSPVSIGRSNTYYAEIVDGLEPGQIYVAKGGFTMKAELEKESFGGGHGH